MEKAAHLDDRCREMFLRLIGEYEGALRRLSRVYANAPQDREDIVQEIAVALWRAMPAFRGESSERTWLYRIAHNTAITISGKQRRKAHGESSIDETFEHPSAAEHEDERLMREQRRRWLLRAIRELPVLDRQILSLQSLHQKPVPVLHQYMSQVAELGFAPFGLLEQSSVGIRGGFVGLVLPLLHSGPVMSQLSVIEFRAASAQSGTR